MTDFAMSEPAENPAELPLAAWHRDRGAIFEERFGCRLPRAYGGLTDEYSALRGECAVVDRSHLDRLEVVGEDRHRFLGGLCTRDVAAMEPGEAMSGFLTESRGRVLADVTVLALPDRFWLELPPGRAAAVGDHLRRYIVADRVEVLPLDEMLPLVVAGEGACERLAGSGVVIPGAAGRHRRGAVLGSEAQIERHHRLGVEGCTLWVSASLAASFADELVDCLGAVPAGLAATETVRVEAGLPAFGIDYGEENLPQEVGIEGAVDFDKGCYLGQEVIARLHYRGQAAKRLRLLRFTSDAEPRLGDQLLFEGRKCGALTSLVRSPRAERSLGLAMLQRRASEAGAQVSTEAGASGEVVADV